LVYEEGVRQEIDGLCDHCHLLKLVEYIADPYLEEISGEIEISWWCNDCYIDRADDI